MFLLERMENDMKTPSPEDVQRSRDGILKAAGSWKGIDTEAFKAYINNRRHTGQEKALHTVLELAPAGLLTLEDRTKQPSEGLAYWKV